MLRLDLIILTNMATEPCLFLRFRLFHSHHSHFALLAPLFLPCPYDFLQHTTLTGGVLLDDKERLASLHAAFYG